MQRSTFHLSVDIFDRFMSVAPTPVLKANLQLVGVTALFTASKIEEIYPPKLHDFAYVTDGACKEDDILAMEMLLLKVHLILFGIRIGDVADNQLGRQPDYSRHMAGHISAN
jgi:hypothetical protein